MKDCILSLIWPKSEIYSFFADHRCAKADLRPIDDFKERQLSRSVMVDTMFNHLSAKPDGGLGPFRAMLQSLLEWSRFDPYYFDQLRKLDRAKAKKHLQHLRQLQEIRDSKIQTDRERRAAAEIQKQPELLLPQLLSKFLELHAGKVKAQKRGYELEGILTALATISSLEVTEPFRVRGEQIDGSLKYDGEHYLIEAKWQDVASSNESVYQFVGKAEGKMYGRGIFVSIQGFSDHVVRSVVVGKAIKTIFIDGEDIVLVLEGHLSFRELIDKKVKAAQTRGLIYVNPLTGASKVTEP
jgi:hypothetical protein